MRNRIETNCRNSGTKCHAAGFPEATPKTDPDFPKQADPWINGGTPVETNIGKNKVADSFSGTVL